MSEQLMAMVAESAEGRVYISPTPTHTTAAETARKFVAEHGDEMDLPVQECRGTFASNAQGRRYKFRTFADYFTARQLLALTTFSDLVATAREQVLSDAKPHWSGAHADDTRRLTDGGLGAVAYADAVATYLGFAVDKAADRNSSLCAWEPNMNRMRNTFGRQALPMVWDYVETIPSPVQAEISLAPRTQSTRCWTSCNALLPVQSNSMTRRP